MEKVITRVWQTIQNHNLFSRGDTIVIGVSGGPDSVGLTVILERLNRYYKNNWRLALAHLNHCIRGKHAVADDRFVQALAKQLGLPCYTERRNIPQLSRQLGLSLEETARQERYAFFERVARKLGKGVKPKISVGHTLDDQAETVLFRIIRGTGIKGLRGILPKRRLSAGSDFRLTRPLIELTHQEILGFLKDQKIGYRLDATNLDQTILRNRIRRELMPLLRQYNPGVVRHLVQLGEDAQRNEDVIASIIRQRYSRIKSAIKISDFRKEHPAVQVAVLTEIIRNIKGNLKLIVRTHYEAIQKLVKSGKGEAHLPGGIVAQVKQGMLRLDKIST